MMAKGNPNPPRPEALRDSTLHYWMSRDRWLKKHPGYDRFIELYHAFKEYGMTKQKFKQEMGIASNSSLNELIAYHEEELGQFNKQ